MLQADELHAHRSPIYRALDVGGAEIGFNAWPAYDLLGLAARRPTAVEPTSTPTTGFATFQLARPGDVDAALLRASIAGRVVKRPFATYYAQWQAVAADPEDNVFRLACTVLPSGVTAPTLDSLGIVLAPGPDRAMTAH